MSASKVPEKQHEKMLDLSLYALTKKGHYGGLKKPPD